MKDILLWVCRILAAALMLQTLYYKFSGAEESVYIFTAVGIEPWGRYATGTAELFASILILFPRTSVYGALLAIGIMVGAIATHLFVLGIVVKDDGGQLFIYACCVLVASLYIVYRSRRQLEKLISKQKIR